MNIPHLQRSLRKIPGLLIYLLFKLVLGDTLPGRYQFSSKDWILIIKLSKKTNKSLSRIYMKASFYIWLGRNSSGWFSNTSLIITEDAKFPAAGSKDTNPFRESQSSNTVCLSSQPIRKLRKCDRQTKHPSLFKKGNACYANSIL